MNELEKLKQKCAELQAEIERLENIGKKQFEPKVWGYYYKVVGMDTDGRGEIYEINWVDDSDDHLNFIQGNCKRTKEEAERYGKRIWTEHQLREQAGYWEPDWDDKDQRKWYLTYDHCFKQWKWEWGGAYIIQIPNTVYFPEKDEALLTDPNIDLNALLEE